MKRISFLKSLSAAWNSFTLRRLYASATAFIASTSRLENLPSFFASSRLSASSAFHDVSTARVTTHGVRHDLAEDHILERKNGPAVLHGRHALKCFNEIGQAIGCQTMKERVKRSPVIALFSLENPSLHFNSSLQQRRTIDCVCGGAGGGKGGLIE
jgi:hypothetical protein